MSNFSKAIEDAQKLPEIPEELEGALPDLFRADNTPAMSERIMDTDGSKVPYAGKHSYKYDCKRLIIGQVQTGFDHGGPIYEPQDDSQELKDIMDKELQAEAIVIKKETSFLKDGTIVIWIEWAEPVAPVAKQNNLLGLKQLLSPESHKPEDLDDSEDSI